MSGTVTSLGTATLGLALCLMVAGVSEAAYTGAQATAAADLAALAAADALRAPSDAGQVPVPCALAAEVASRNGARLTGCEAGTVSDVTVWVEAPTAWGGVSHGVARAGPAPE